MYKLITYSDELYHYGVMGMRWGVRRYQNYDGTRISEGDPPAVDSSKVADANGNGGVTEDEKSKSIGEKVFGPSIKKGKGKEDTSVAQETTKHLLELNRANKDLVKGLKEVDPKVKEANEKQEKSLAKKAKKMSDKELRDSINRIKMEREYVSLNKQEVKTGYDKALDIMDKAEPFVRVAAEVAGLILLLYKIKGVAHSATDDQIVDICKYCVDNGFNNDIIKHAMDLDVEYIIDYYNVSDKDLEHILYGEDYLEHHGIKGMKWGVRRYQNYDGTRIGAGSGSGGGGGGSNKASKSFRDTIVGGQGGKAVGNERLAATVVTKSSEPLYHYPPKNSKERRQNEILKSKKDKELFGESNSRSQKVFKTPEDLQKESEARKENIRKGVKAIEKSWKEREENLGKFYDEVDKLGGYDGPDGKNSKAAREKYDTAKYHSIDALTRAVVKDRYSKLQIGDLDDEMISLGREWGLVNSNNNLESYWEKGELKYRVKRR